MINKGNRATLLVLAAIWGHCKIGITESASQIQQELEPPSCMYRWPSLTCSIFHKGAIRWGRWEVKFWLHVVKVTGSILPRRIRFFPYCHWRFLELKRTIPAEEAFDLYLIVEWREYSRKLLPWVCLLNTAAPLQCSARWTYGVLTWKIFHHANFVKSSPRVFWP